MQDQLAMKCGIAHRRAKKIADRNLFLRVDRRVRSRFFDTSRRKNLRAVLRNFAQIALRADDFGVRGKKIFRRREAPKAPEFCATSIDSRQKNMRIACARSRATHITRARK